MKIGALISVRLASERLPGKQLKEICGRPMIYHLLDRVAACRHIADKRQVVVCTTTDPSDDPLVPVIEAYGCSVFRGAVNDIIRRLADAISTHGFDAVIQADGDNPLAATEYMDAVTERLRSDPSLDIVSVTGLPIGIATRSYTAKAMDKVIAAYRTQNNDTGYMHFFTKTGLCKHEVLGPISSEHVLDEARLTLDYEIDLEMFRQLFGALYVPGRVFGFSEAVQFLKKHPGIMKINNHITAEYWQRMAQKFYLEFVAADGSVATIHL